MVRTIVYGHEFANTYIMEFLGEIASVAFCGTLDIKETCEVLFTVFRIKNFIPKIIYPEVTNCMPRRARGDSIESRAEEYKIFYKHPI